MKDYLIKKLSFELYWLGLEFITLAFGGIIVIYFMRRKRKPMNRKDQG